MTTTNSERPETGNLIIDELTCWIGAKYSVNAIWHDESQWTPRRILTESRLARLAQSLSDIGFIEIFENGVSVCHCDYRTVN